jgi:hypothetical protein
MIGFIAPYAFTYFGTTGNYSAMAIVHNLPVHRYTRTRILILFTSRILATDLSQSHCHFKSHMKCSWHSLIPFWSFLINHLRLPSPAFGPILFLALWDPRYIASRRTNRKHRIVYCCEDMFTAPLPNNGCTRHSIFLLLLYVILHNTHYQYFE